jgi:CHAD domain-containing protein
MAITLHPKKLIGEEIQRLLTVLLADTEHALGFFERDTATAIHSIRTAMKRVKAVLGLARRELPAGPVEKALTLTREIKNIYANTREEEVLRRCCLNLCRSDDEVRLVEHWFSPRSPVSGPFDPVLKAKLSELRGTLQPLPFWVITPKGIRAAFLVTAARVKKGRSQSKNRGSTEDFHEWRKQVKDLWMQATALRKIVQLPDQVREQARKLGETLGTANDLANLCERLSQIAAPDAVAASALLQRAENRLEETQQRALDQGKKLQQALQRRPSGK